MSKIKTVAIVGGGVSGLSAACYLARNGVQVKLFEANEKAGGCCGTTETDGYAFSDGAVYLAAPAILDHVFQRLGLDRAALLPLRRMENHKTTLPDGSIVYLRDRSVEVLSADGKRSGNCCQEELRCFLERWEPVLRLFEEDLMLHPFSLPDFIRKGWRHLHKFQGTVASELSNCFKDEAVRSALSGAVLYTGAPPEKNPARSFLGLASLLSEGFYLPEGGIGKIPEALAVYLKCSGGEIHLNSKVKRIVLRNGRAAGLEVEGKGVVEADAVLSSITGMATFTNLLTEREVPQSMKRKVRSAPLSHRGMAVQLGLSNVIDVDSHSNHILPMMDEQYKALLPEEEALNWLTFSVPTVTDPDLAPQGGSIVEIFPPVEQQIHVDYWDDEKKEQVAALAIEKLCELHKVEIATKRVFSPRDFRDRLHLYQGALCGLSPVADPRAQFAHDSGIPGLYLAGQTTYPGYGVAPAAMSGILAAEAILK